MIIREAIKTLAAWTMTCNSDIPLYMVEAAAIAHHEERRKTQKSLKEWDRLTHESKLEKMKEIKAALIAARDAIP